MSDKRLCEDCGRDIALRADGTLRKHRDDSGDECGASGSLPTSSIALPWGSPPLARNEARRDRLAIAHGEALWAIRDDRPQRFAAANVVLHHRRPYGDPKAQQPASSSAARGELVSTLMVILDALAAERVVPSTGWQHVPFAGIQIHAPTAGLPAAMWFTLTAPTLAEDE